MAKASHTLTTKRLVIGHISVCQGCCCGQTERGNPAVPVERLKSEWRRRGLLKNIQLSISGCLGRCDVPNVVKIDTGEESIWLGEIDSLDQYREILDWASQAACFRCRSTWRSTRSILSVSGSRSQGSSVRWGR